MDTKTYIWALKTLLLPLLHKIDGLPEKFCKIGTESFADSQQRVDGGEPLSLFDSAYHCVAQAGTRGHLIQGQLLAKALLAKQTNQLRNNCFALRSIEHMAFVTEVALDSGCDHRRNPWRQYLRKNRLPGSAASVISTPVESSQTLLAMKAPRTNFCTSALTGCLTLFAFFAFSSGILLGDTSPNQQTGSVSQTGTSATTAPAIFYQILHQNRVNLGNRSIIYNLVAPPVLPKRPGPPIPAPKLLTPEEEQAEVLREQKDWQQFIFSATIYDHRVTVVSWGENRQYRAYSNIDFNHFCGVENVETDTTVYVLYFMSSNESSEYDQGAMNRLPPRHAFSPNRFEYILDKSCPSPPAEALAAIDALHTYYNANSQKLAADYAKRIAEQRAQELWSKAHPPLPKDSVVNFWPIKSSVYLGSDNKGGEK